MGLLNFPGPSEGVLPFLAINTVMSVALVKNMIKSLLKVVGGDASQEFEEEYSGIDGSGSSRVRRVSIKRYSSLCSNQGSSGRGGGEGEGGGDGVGADAMECCVCLCRFQGNDEVSELICKHFFHMGCLDKWFDNHHNTCPLCRSIM